MALTKDDVLQKVNEYCTEKQYTVATLTDSFKDKFADHFLKANPEGDISDESLIANLKFALNTAFSSASELATVKTTEFTTKENGYKVQIAELQKQIKTQKPPVVQPTIPQEVQDQLKELQAYKDERSKKEKFENILKLAKEGVRDDLHSSLEKYAKDYDVKLDKEDKEQADALVARFKDIFKDSLGDIRPQKPTTTQKQVEDVIGSIPKVKISN